MFASPIWNPSPGIRYVFGGGLTVFTPAIRFAFEISTLRPLPWGMGPEGSPRRAWLADRGQGRTGCDPSPAGWYRSGVFVYLSHETLSSGPHFQVAMVFEAPRTASMIFTYYLFALTAKVSRIQSPTKLQAMTTRKYGCAGSNRKPRGCFDIGVAHPEQGPHGGLRRLAKKKKKKKKKRG